MLYKTLDIKDIHRGRLSEPVIKQYQGMQKTKDIASNLDNIVIPPIEVIKFDGKYVINDGIHRFCAHLLANKTHIDAKIVNIM